MTTSKAPGSRRAGRHCLAAVLAGTTILAAAPLARSDERASVEPIGAPLTLTRAPSVAPDQSAPPVAQPSLDALRWYASEGDHARVRAETARLRELHPGWSPPANLDEDEGADELWSLFAADELDAIEARLAESGGGSRAVPEGLAEAVASKRAAWTLAAAHARAATEPSAETWQRVLDLANASPDLVVVNVELLWFVARAYGELGRHAEARETIAHALTRTGPEPLAVEGTAHAALAALGAVAAAPMLEEWAKGMGERSAARVAHVLTRHRLAEAGRQREDVAGYGADAVRRRRSGAIEVPTKPVLPFAALARSEPQRAGDRELMGWWHHRAGRHEAALAWFEASGDGAWSGSRGEGTERVGPIEGRVLSLMALGRTGDALALAARHERASDALGRLLVEVRARALDDVFLEDAEPVPGLDVPALLAALSTGSTRWRSPRGAESLGWYAVHRREWTPARAWFTRAVEWREDEADEVPSPAIRTVEPAPPGTLLDPEAVRAVAVARATSPSERHGTGTTLVVSYRAGTATPMPPVAGAPVASGVDRPDHVGTDRAHTVLVARGSGVPVPSLRRGVGVRLAAARPAGRRGAALGLALAQRALGDRDGFRDTQARYGAYPQIAALGAFAAPKPARTKATSASRAAKPRAGADGTLRRRIVAAHEGGRTADCLRLSAKLAKPEAADHEMRGWCLMEARRHAEADRAFRAAIAAGASGDASYGLSLSRFARGMTDDARSAATNVLHGPQRRTLAIELLTQRARAAHAVGDHAATLHALDRRSALVPEPRDLALIRGWSLYHGGARRSAAALFARLDAQLSTRDTRRALAQIRRARRSNR